MHSDPPPSDLALRLAAAGRVPAERLFVALAGLLAIGLALLEFFLQAFSGNVILGGGPAAWTAPLIALCLSLVLGIFLLHAHATLLRDPVEGAILAAGFSLALLFFGGTSGAAAGLLGALGAAVVLVRHARVYEWIQARRRAATAQEPSPPESYAYSSAPPETS